MAKVVIDANVIISAAFGGKPLETLARATEDHEVYLSEGVERELRGSFQGFRKNAQKTRWPFLRRRCGNC